MRANFPVSDDPIISGGYHKDMLAFTLFDKYSLNVSIRNPGAQLKIYTISTFICRIFAFAFQINHESYSSIN